MVVRVFVTLLLNISIVLASDDINSLLNEDPKAQAIIGTITKSIPLGGGFSGEEVHLINDKFVLKKFNSYNPVVIEIQKRVAKWSLAPNIIYANPKKKIVMMDFLGKDHLPRNQYTIVHLAQFLKTLHQISYKDEVPQMSGKDYFGIVREHLKVLQNANVPKTILKKLTSILKLEKHKYSERAICHNDLNPNNILFVNNKIMAIDWDEAGLNDPYFDLGTILMWYINIPDIETKLLQHYLGRAPKKNELEHLKVMKKLAMTIAGVEIIQLGLEIGYKNNPNIPIDSLSEFLPKIGKTVNLNSGEKLYEFGLIILKEI